jgi:multicomponent Na+:H+ antiporter subunit C
MTEAQLYGVCGAGLVGIGLYGATLGCSALRRLLAFNLIGSGVFILFGAVARRGGVAGGMASDPVPQALVITGLVVAFAATALAVALLIRLDTAKSEDARAGLHPARSGEQPAGAIFGSDPPGGTG